MEESYDGIARYARLVTKTDSPELAAQALDKQLGGRRDLVFKTLGPLLVSFHHAEREAEWLLKEASTATDLDEEGKQLAREQIRSDLWLYARAIAIMPRVYAALMRQYALADRQIEGAK